MWIFKKEVVACNLSVFNHDEYQRYQELRKELTLNVQHKELSTGYALLYPNDPQLLMKIAEWVSFENRCCPFLTFTLHAQGNKQQIQLDITGSEEVKTLLQHEFDLA